MSITSTFGAQLVGLLGADAFATWQARSAMVDGRNDVTSRFAIASKHQEYQDQCDEKDFSTTNMYIPCRKTKRNNSLEETCLLSSGLQA